jgi:pyruvate,water dikinase
MLHKLIGDISIHDLPLVGGKGANLGELTQAGIPVPHGFVVTSSAYFRFLEGSQLRATIQERLTGLDVNDSLSLNGIAAEIKSLIAQARVPDEIATDIAAAYARMGGGLAAVRSSATAEDLAEASFAGQHESYLNVEGATAITDAVQSCWASLFEPRALFYRTGVGFDHASVGIAVVVQQMVQSERSGVMFTVHPVTNDHSQVVIEAVYGLGEAIVSGAVTPDAYIVDKASGSVLECQIASQERQLAYNNSVTEPGNEWLDVHPDLRSKPKLSEREIAELTSIGARIADHFGCAQDIEWAHAEGAFHVIQARAVTTL